MIKDAEIEGWMRSLSYFVRMKSLYKNNTHYNFTLRSLSSRLKCSPSCLMFHLRYLNEKGLISYHSKNISFIGLKKLQIIYGVKNIGVPVDNKNQLDILRAQIIRFNLSTQEHIIKKSGIQKCTNNIVPFTRNEKANSSYVGLSAKGLGGLFKLSTGSGSRIRKKLFNLGIIHKERMFSVLYKGISLQDYKNMKYTFVIPAYAILRNGIVLVERRSCLGYIK